MGLKKIQESTLGFDYESAAPFLLDGDKHVHKRKFKTGDIVAYKSTYRGGLLRVYEVVGRHDSKEVRIVCLTGFQFANAFEKYMLAFRELESKLKMV